MALSTASRVCGRTAWASLRTLETVWCETPARWATSAMVGALEAAVMPGILVPGHRSSTGPPLGRGRSRGSVVCTEPRRVAIDRCT